ncbi:OLC1v1032352C1 [Oldenlandia corymbosa var. corymbosa]|uniref:OLC1v1032352C1 n=1 Tax=Oldenlandia corymbosa var. corymbosa TaxID=529605 RepID=A0AAV1CKT6_OLDCO|nr:OLC1v1032352C1 [Oldenlandia corymbosa var. corymbosa]
MDHLGAWDGAESAEDVLFYEELRRQVLILTAEEDDDDEYQENKHPNIGAKSLHQTVAHSPASALQTQQPGCYYQWSGGETTDSVPRWVFNVWNPGSGTGVFIPQIVKSRRRNKPRKKNNERGRTYKPIANVA